MTEGLRASGGGIISYLRNIVGTYTPLTDSNGEIITSSAGIDWEYIVSACIFILCLYFMLKYIALIFKK